MLSRIYGVFKVKIKYIHAINIMIMENIMGDNLGEVERVYDLKGSLFAR